MQPSTTPPVAAPASGPARFHNAKARFKKLVAARRTNSGAVATCQDHGTENSGETSNESLSEHRIVDTATTIRRNEANDDTYAAGSRHDSVFDAATEQLYLPSAISARTPRPRRQNLRQATGLPEHPRLRPDADGTRGDGTTASYDDDQGESLSQLRQRMDEGFARLDVHQQQLNRMVARMDQEFSEERVAEAKLRAAREKKKAEAQRLGERIVKETAPRSANGRAYSDLSEIRRCAAPRATYQMVSDSNYPRFGPSS